MTCPTARNSSHPSVLLQCSAKLSWHCPHFPPLSSPCSLTAQNFLPGSHFLLPASPTVLVTYVHIPFLRSMLGRAEGWFLQGEAAHPPSFRSLPSFSKAEWQEPWLGHHGTWFELHVHHYLRDHHYLGKPLSVSGPVNTFRSPHLPLPHNHMGSNAQVT